MHLALLLATVAALPQDPTHEPTMLERIDALIAKSNTYEHFVARYRIRTEKGEEGELRLIFRSPDQARVTFDLGGGHSESCIHGDTLLMRVSGEATGAHTATIRNPRAEAECLALVQSRLRDAFPKGWAGDQAVAEPRLTFSFDIDTDGRELGFDAGFGGPAYLMWLMQLRGLSTKLSWTPGEHPTIDYSPHEDVRVHVSAENGLITRIERQTKAGVHVGLELTEFDSDARPDSKAFELSPAAPGEADDSETAEADFARRGLQRGRASVFYTVARLLDDGGLEWNDSASERIEDILRALAARELEVVFRPFAAQQRGWIGTIEEWLSTALEQPGAEEPEQLTALREQVAQSREALQANVSKAVDQLLGPAFPREKCKSRVVFPDELRAMEKRVVSDLVAEMVTKPLLALFDEKVAKQLESK